MSRSLPVLTETEAKSRLETCGYENVGHLEKNSNGLWIGVAQKNARVVYVAVDIRGNVYFRNQDQVDSRVDASMQSFSQLGQDIFVYNTFFRERRTKGYFVDIGAYDGVTFSNSLFFERHLGWQGVCIEPLPSAFSLLKLSRAAICLNCAVSDCNGVGEFTDVDMPEFGKMYSGLRTEYNPRHAKLVQQYASNQRTIQVQLRRLPDILDQLNVRTIDYLSIDIEGGELKVLQTLDFASCDIRVMSVENIYNDPEIRNYLAGFGYRLVKVFSRFDDLYAKNF